MFETGELRFWLLSVPAGDVCKRLTVPPYEVVYIGLCLSTTPLHRLAEII